ncbi:MAG: hypothetical protein M1817_000018 [Caeruleum heppii]|nr:MAG: hypothetical protein M1817_000018 [Caeruleum heppii]
MVFGRSIPSLRSLTARPVRLATSREPKPVYFQRFYAHSGYGDGDGDPKGENPNQQGANPSADLEHPGPPPVQEGQGSGSTATKGSANGHKSSAGSAAESPSKKSSSQEKSSSKGAQPKIHDERNGPTNTREDVEQHNREFERRHDRPQSTGDERDQKVDKQFWKGQGGADRQA